MLKSDGGRPTTEYLLTIDAAKELAMVEGNEKGKIARRYFIHCEKQLKLIRQGLPHDYLSALQALLEEVQSKKKLQLKLEEAEAIAVANADKAAYVDQVLESTSSWTTTTIAKELGMSAIALNEKLNKLGVQYKQDRHWVLYSRYEDLGYTVTRTFPFNHADGSHGTDIQTRWTEKGREFIHRLLNTNLIPDSHDEN